MANRNKPLVLETPSVESFDHTVETAVSMTGDPIEYAFVTSGKPSTWEAGAWTSAWADGKAKARTPTIGATGSGADVELADGAYDAWVRITGSTEQPARQFDQLIVR